MQFDSPGGGLFLHWIFTVIPILSLGKMYSDGRIFMTGLFQYGYEILTGKFHLQGLNPKADLYSVHGYWPFPVEVSHASLPTTLGPHVS